MERKWMQKDAEQDGADRTRRNGFLSKRGEIWVMC